MPFRIKITTKTGNILYVDVADRETAEAECRCIQRMRKERWGLPVLAARDAAGQRWCYAPNEIIGELEIGELQPELLAG